jgi:hypothetical protein
MTKTFLQKSIADALIQTGIVDGRHQTFVLFDKLTLLSPEFEARISKKFIPEAKRVLEGLVLLEKAMAKNVGDLGAFEGHLLKAKKTCIKAIAFYDSLH